MVLTLEKFGEILQLRAFKISIEGYVLLQFAPTVASRQYDWTRKQVFSLSMGEMGTVILGARESCEFFHDRIKGKSISSDFGEESGGSDRTI
ncbi:single-stranded DNA-binding protein WHY1, chloroplastic-like [Arachis hypogaea]|uniref:single-stranded DNA-binding protein WHY1, chloroplastic-like n=1 Tax=Arachis hypogaea TaxID=3818 RepID=UPI0034E7D06D